MLSDYMPAFATKKFSSLLAIIALATLVSLTSCQPVRTSAESTTNINPDSLANEGFNVFRENPGKAIPLLRSAAIAYESSDSLFKAGMMFLNVANIYDEYVPQIDSAIYYAKQSMENYEKANDSMQMANLYKYYGYLIGVNGNPVAGKSYIQQAIAIYQEKNFKEGIAVSHFNLARIFIQTKEFVKADSLLDLAKPVWIETNDTSRLSLIETEKTKIADLNK